MNYATWRRNGSAWYTAQIAAPPSGQEYSFATGASDGAFYNEATWLGVFCTESNNALTTTNNFKYYRSLNWGSSWTGVTISTAYNDFYPSAELRPGSGPSTDSVWIAVERRLSTSQYEIRIIRTPWSPTASSNTYFVTSGGSSVKYEKPALTVKQNRTCDSALFTVTKMEYRITALLLTAVVYGMLTTYLEMAAIKHLHGVHPERPVPIHLWECGFQMTVIQLD